jgi:cytochrome c553
MKTLKNIGKWALRVVGVLAVLLAVAYTIIHFTFNSRLNTEYPVQAARLTIPTDSASIARGAHIVSTRGCGDCHAANLAGKVFVDDPALGKLVASNLTKGNGGIGATYTDADWIKAIRHGVGPDNKALVVMPSEEYNGLSNRDLADLIAYLKTIPAVDNELPEHQFNPLLRTLFVTGNFPMLTNADKIDHTAEPVEEMTVAATEDYGKYLVKSCTGCHGTNLKGQEMPIPGMKPSVDITSTGRLSKWSDVQFIQTLRTGLTPEGHQLDNKDMPWEMTKNYTDEELKAIYLYLKKHS